MNDQAVQEARECVAELIGYEKLEAPAAWRLADLTAENTPGQGNRNTGSPVVSSWAEQIGWLAAGRSVKTLSSMAAEARAWPTELRVENATFWQHYEARKELKDVEKASAWLHEKVVSGEPVTAPRPRKQDIAQVLSSASAAEIAEAMESEPKAKRKVLGATARLDKKDAQAQQQREEDLTREHGRDWHDYTSDALRALAEARRSLREAHDAVQAARRTDQLVDARYDLVVASAEMTKTAAEYVVEAATAEADLAEEFAKLLEEAAS